MPSYLYCSTIATLSLVSLMLDGNLPPCLLLFLSHFLPRNKNNHPLLFVWSIARSFITFYYILSSPSYRLCVWVVCFLIYKKENNLSKAVLTFCLYHLYTDIVSYIENITMGQFLWSFFYLFFTAHTSTYIINNPLRLRGVLPLVVNTVLFPMSFNQLCQQSKTPDSLYRDPQQVFITMFYMAYCVVDMLMGRYYGPAHFTIMEKYNLVWSFLSAFYSFQRDQMSCFCMDLHTHIPDIVLYMSMTFYDVPWVQSLKEDHYHLMYIWYKIITPVFFIICFHKISMGFDCLFLYCINTMLSSHWVYLQMI